MRRMDMPRRKPPEHANSVDAAGSSNQSPQMVPKSADFSSVLMEFGCFTSGRNPTIVGRLIFYTIFLDVLGQIFKDRSTSGRRRSSHFETRFRLEYDENHAHSSVGGIFSRDRRVINFLAMFIRDYSECSNRLSSAAILD